MFRYKEGKITMKILTITILFMLFSTPATAKGLTDNDKQFLCRFGLIAFCK